MALNLENRAENGRNLTRVGIFLKKLLILYHFRCYNEDKTDNFERLGKDLTNTFLAINPNTLLIAVLVAAVVVLFIMLLVEKSKRKKAQTRASKLSAEARRTSDTDMPYDNGAIHTVKEDNPEEEPTIKVKPDNRKPLSNSVIPQRENSPRANSLYQKPAADEAPEKINNGKVYSDDKLLIDELDADETEFLILPQKSKKQKKASDKLMQSLVIEETYKPLFAPAAQSVKPEPVQQTNPAVEAEPKKAPEQKPAPTVNHEESKPAPTPTPTPIPTPYGNVADKLMGISAAFASLANRAAPKPATAKAPVEANKENKAQPEAEKAPRVLDTLSDKAKQYADRADMFEKAPYKLPEMNLTPNPAAFAPAVSVPAKLNINMNEQSAVRDGEVTLNIFMKSDNEEKSVPKESLYDVVDSVKPVFEASDVISSADLGERYTVEENKKAPLFSTDGKAEAAQSSGVEQLLIVEETPRSNIEDEGTPCVINGETVEVRYRSSFMSRLIQAPTEVQEIYGALKNEILSYSGLKVKNSWNYESFNRDGEQCVKLNVRGRSVMVYLALNPKDYLGTKYRFKDMSATPKFEKVPMLLSVRTERGIKYATELIAELMKKIGAARGQTQNVDYRMPYEDNAALALRGLVKLILPDGVSVDNDFEVVSVNVDEYINGSTRPADN